MAKAARKRPAKTAKKSSGATAKASASHQPQSMADAATTVGVFLHTDDAWSLAYFDANDLHNLERELFAKAS
jgi:hypothetical protein